jgi:CubicO group peptidase (beta-lactamase class C family)
VREENLRLDLYIGDDGAGGIGGFWFFRDQRLPALWGYGLECREYSFSVGEKNLGLNFEGQFDRDQDLLVTTVAGVGGEFPVTFRRLSPELVPSLPDAPSDPARQHDNAVYVERPPIARNGDWQTSIPSDSEIDVHIIREMVRAIAEGEMGLTHSVLVARHGKLVVEEYFYGFDLATWHDMRSASKSLASTLVGLAIQDGYIEGVHSPVLPLLPRYRNYANWDSRKALITVADLLNMNSGLDANDYDPQSFAAEGNYQSQIAEPDWVKLALDAPMVSDAGAPPLVYGGANPLIIGGILSQVINEPVEWYADRELFAKLGIEHYKFLLDPTGVAYMGGGLHLRPRDMLKFGQLYLNKGVWAGRRILSQEWVKESWTPRGQLKQFQREHAYGYLWWHYLYEVGEHAVEAIEARGNGGQYISVFPSLDLVVVITGGNFRNGRPRQPEEILQQFVLPAVLLSSGEAE